MNIYFIHIQYTHKYEYESIKRLYNFKKKIAGNLNSYLIIIENDCFSESKLKTDFFIHQFKIFGTNNYLDFSGYEEGLNYIKNNFLLQENDIFIFSNDTFYRHRYFDGLFQNRFLNKIILLKNIEKPYLIGYKDKNSIENCFINDISFKEHFSTFFFILNKKAIDLINILSINFENTTIEIDDNFVKINDKRDNYSLKIYNWFFKPTKESWYRAIDYDSFLKSNIKIKKYMLLKLYTVLNEHNLYIQATERDIHLESIFPDNKYKLINILKSIEFRITKYLISLGFLNYIK